MTMNLEKYEFEYGVTLTKTYAHLFSPFLIAFKPAEKGKPHPAPWKTVSGGASFDILLELYIPQKFEPQWSDRINTIWFLAALLRFTAGNHLLAPVISNSSFKDAAGLETAHFWPIETNQRILLENSVVKEITKTDLDWINDHWYKTTKLLSTSKEFAFLFLEYDQCCFARNRPQALIMLWSGLENLFSASDSRTELRFRISANIAAYLETSGNARRELYRKLVKLYDKRSAAVHGIPKNVEETFLETHTITKAIIKKIIETGNVPNKESLEVNLFGT